MLLQFVNGQVGTQIRNICDMPTFNIQSFNICCNDGEIRELAILPYSLHIFKTNIKVAGEVLTCIIHRYAHNIATFLVN